MMEDHNWIADHHTLFCVGTGILLGMEGFGAANYDFELQPPTHSHPSEPAERRGSHGKWLRSDPVWSTGRVESPDLVEFIKHFAGLALSLSSCPALLYVIQRTQSILIFLIK